MLWFCAIFVLFFVPILYYIYVLCDFVPILCCPTFDRFWPQIATIKITYLYYIYDFVWFCAFLATFSCHALRCAFGRFWAFYVFPVLLLWGGDGRFVLILCAVFDVLCVYICANEWFIAFLSTFLSSRIDGFWLKTVLNYVVQFVAMREVTGFYALFYLIFMPFLWQDWRFLGKNCVCGSAIIVC
jgi:hypothetical protein